MSFKATGKYLLNEVFSIFTWMNFKCCHENLYHFSFFVKKITQDFPIVNNFCKDSKYA